MTTQSETALTDSTVAPVSAEAPAASDVPAPPPSAALAPRLASLDALRGFNMIWITGFDVVLKALAVALGLPLFKHFLDVQLSHGPWPMPYRDPDYGHWAKGFHAYDMIMPLFLFCAGTSLPFSFAKRLAAGQPKSRIYRHVAIRFAILYILGLVAQGNLLNFSLESLKLYSNTLQAIACGYLIASLLLLNLRLAGQVAVTALLVAAYWALLRFIPVPNDRGGWNPAGLLTPDVNPAIWLDYKLLGRFQDGTYYTWILTSMVFGATVMTGALAGQLLRTSESPARKFLGLASVGAILLSLGLIWSLWAPIVKYIWSSSFVLYSSGISFLLLAAFYLVIDVWGLRRWAVPLVVIGANCILAYMLGEVHLIPFRDISIKLVGGLQHHFQAFKIEPWYFLMRDSLSFALLYLLLHYMYKNKTFLRV